MLTNTRLIRVQWGDCDPAGIVFYPRYFEWFDAGTILLFEKATGLTKIKMLERYGGAGLALIEAGAKFAVPSQYGDDIEIETSVKEFGRSSFSMEHRITAPESRYGAARLVATADSVLVSYDYAAERPIPVPDRLRRGIEAFEGGPGDR